MNNDEKKHKESGGLGVVISNDYVDKFEVLSNASLSFDESSGDGGKGQKKRCCEWLYFHDIALAKGYCILSMARGTLVMSNIFLSTSFIYLASQQAGCLVAPANATNTTTTGQYDYLVDENCDTSVYGFQPSSFVTNIAVISGLAAAFTMPFIGALIDYTNYRRKIGILSALLMTVIQAAQIFTLAETWFPMAILQAIAGWLYQVQVLASYAYLPDIARQVGEKIMTRFSSTFTSVQFLAQVFFLILIVAISMALGLNDVFTGQLSQGVNVAMCVLLFAAGWRYMPHVGPKRTLGEGQNLFTTGFLENFRTAKLVNTKYGSSLRWFLLAVCFAEAGANAFTVVCVLFMSQTLGMTASQIGIIIAITMVATVPGTVIGGFVTSKTNPNTSWKLSMIAFIISTLVGAFILSSPEQQYLAYVMSVVWGLCLGWFYPTEGLFFSLALPKGREAELSGFYVYCTQIIVWLPPLIFSILNERGVHQRYGVMSLTVFFAIAIVILCFIPNDWKLFLEEVNQDESDTDCSNGKEDKEDEEVPVVNVVASNVTSYGKEDKEEHASEDFVVVQT